MKLAAVSLALYLVYGVHLAWGPLKVHGELQCMNLKYLICPEIEVDLAQSCRVSTEVVFTALKNGICEIGKEIGHRS